MKKIILIFTFMLAVLMFVSFVGCSDSKKGTTDGTQVKASAIQVQNGYNPGKVVPDGIVSGSVLNYCHAGQDVPGHFPWTNSQSSYLHINIYDALFYYYQGDTSDIRGAIVESWKFADDMLSVIMQVRKGVRFSNGNPLDAQVVVDSYTITKPLNPAPFRNIKNMEATGEYELTFTFNNYYPDFLQRFGSYQCSVADPRAMEEFGPEDNRAAIGTGPYYIERYSAGEICVLKAKPNYYLPEKQPHIETVNLLIIPNMQTQLAAFMAGDLDLMKSSSLEQVYALQDAGMSDNVIFHPSPTQTFYFNVRRVPIFKNIKVREALTKLLDWDAICSLVFDNVNVRATSMFSVGSPAWVDNSKWYYHNPDEALQILREAGVKPNDISFTILTNPLFANVATAMQAQFLQYGINVTLEQVEAAVLQVRGTTDEWDVFNTHGNFSELTMVNYYSTLVPKPTGFKFIFNDPELDAYLRDLYVKCSTSPTFEELLDYHRQITGILLENYICMGGYHSYEFYCHKSNVKNIVCLTVVGYPEFCYYYLEN
jgi:ABC-type transport system substrate-binding protein